jgi:transcriptional regulator with PAS, ATPase and Fis domain
MTIALDIASSPLFGRHDGTIKFSREIVPILMQYDWPGNVRELKNVINYAKHNLLAGESVIEPRHLPSFLISKVEEPSVKTISPSFKKGIEKKEREIIVNALKSTMGNKLAAAKLLNMPRSVLYSKLKKYDLNR